MTVHLQHDLERLFSPTFGSGFGSKSTLPPAECSITANGNHDAGNSCKKPEDLVNPTYYEKGLYGPCTPAKT